MFTWAKLALAVVQLFSSLAVWFREHQFIKAGKDKATVEIQKGELDAIAKATKAREDSKSSNVTIPESDSLPDDEFRRD